MNVEIQLPDLVPIEEEAGDPVRLNLQHIHATLEEVQQVLYKVANAIEELS